MPPGEPDRDCSSFIDASKAKYQGNEPDKPFHEEPSRDLETTITMIQPGRGPDRPGMLSDVVAPQFVAGCHAGVVLRA